MIAIGTNPAVNPFLPQRVDLGYWVADYQRWLDHAWEQCTYQPYLTRAYPGPGLLGVSWPVGWRPVWPARLNQLMWPSTAMRWASLHCLVEANYLPAVLDQARGTSRTQNNPITIKIWDTASETITTKMYLLPPVVLQGKNEVMADGNNSNDAYWLTFVDDRFFWWQVATPDFGITPATSWNDLWNDISTALGEPITVDPVPANYFQPHTALNLKYQVIPPVIDTVSTNCGFQLYRGYDGSLYASSPATATQIYSSEYARPTRKFLAGQFAWDGTTQ